MRSIQYHRYGGPEEMRLEEVAIPEPGRGQVRVRVKAASTNPADRKIRDGMLRLVTGSKFPRGYGHDFAGVVDAVGADVDGLKVGDEVYGVSGVRPAGAFADYLIVADKAAYPKPESISFEVAAGLTMASVTAWSGVVDRAQLGHGQSAFITGCLGGVGRAAVQIALMRGARVDGNCSAAGRNEALALGVSEVCDYSGFDTAGREGRFDLVFDTAGALTASQCGAMLKPGGVAVHAVPSAGKFLATAASRRHTIASGNPNPERMAGIGAAAAQGKLVPNIARIVPLSDAVAVLTEHETTGLPKGKLVIVP